MTNFDHYTFASICLRGDYHQVVAYLEGLDDGAERLAEYKAVFEGDKYLLNVDNAEVTKLLHAYEDYLKWVLSNESTPKERQRYVVDKLKPFFPRARFYAHISIEATYWILHVMLRGFFKRHGYTCSPGEVLPYFCISVWGKNIKKTECVELPEATINIEVIRMEGIVTRGWLDYLSKGITSTGGWVTRKGCAYFEDQFEEGSDEYKYVLLAHEGQHWHDKRNYRGIKETDMEYRAKLVELIYLKDELKRFYSFLGGMADTDDRTHPHRYANRRLMQGMSRKVFGVELETDKDKWAEKAAEVAVTALELLSEHTVMMKQRKGKGYVI